MGYNEFINEVEVTIKANVAPEYKVFIQKYTKNNGTQYDGLVILNPSINISPTIYLNPYYHRYLEGVSLSDICNDIMSTYHTYQPKENFNLDFFRDYEKVKEHIIYKLINYEKNEELLGTVPFFRYYDLAIVFQLMLSDYNGMPGTILIHNYQLDYWNITVDRLYSDAHNNTCRLLPYRLYDMYDFIKEKAGVDTLSGNISSACILTNTSNSNGAACILYEGLIKEVSRKLKSNLILIPSSIHEFIIIPTDTYDNLDYYSKLVKEVNEAYVQDDELLSDHAYYYSRAEDEILCNY